MFCCDPETVGASVAGAERERGKDFPGGSVVKNLPSSAGDVGSILGPRRFHMPAEHLYVTTIEARAPSSPSSAIREAARMRSLLTAMKSSPGSLQLEKGFSSVQLLNCVQLFATP